MWVLQLTWKSTKHYLVAWSRTYMCIVTLEDPYHETCWQQLTGVLLARLWVCNKERKLNLVSKIPSIERSVRQEVPKPIITVYICSPIIWVKWTFLSHSHFLSPHLWKAFFFAYRQMETYCSQSYFLLLIIFLFFWKNASFVFRYWIMSRNEQICMNLTKRWVEIVLFSIQYFFEGKSLA